MTEGTGKKSKIKKKLKENYKLVIFRKHDLHEVRSFDLTLANIYVLISVVILGLLTVVYLFFAFTPAKRFIPGYGKIEANEKFMKLVQSVDILTREIDAQEIYIEALNNLLIADPDSSVSMEFYNPKEAASESAMQVINSEEKNISPVVNEKELNRTSNLFKTLGIHRLISPVEGIISSEFDPALKHYGIDILGPKNTAIRAIMDGFVFDSGWNAETGYSVGIQHEDNMLSFYKHNSALLKEKGTFVKAGEAIAIIGNTGTLSNGPHLHFEMWHEGKPVNPEEFINFN